MQLGQPVKTLSQRTTNQASEKANPFQSEMIRKRIRVMNQRSKGISGDYNRPETSDFISFQKTKY